ncbi:MAG: ribose-phosphate pyrophosphokinase [Clostridium sp.]
MLRLNEKLVEVKYFPNGESYIKCEELEIIEGVNKITLNYEGDSELIHLMYLKKHLDSKRIKSKLVLPYMPYSRMDRTEGVMVFTLKYVCEFINSLNFEEVEVWEAHSEVTTALLNRVKEVNSSSKIAIELMEKLKEENVYFVFPDAGAAKRYGKQIESEKILVCNKVRDFKTGYIKSLEVLGEIEEENFTSIIVDDLCSKGGTFMLTGEKLKELGCKDIYLVVTHCEDTIFNGDILKTNLIKEVYTTDSILKGNHEKIKKVNI